MGLIQRLKGWMAYPAIEFYRYECSDCDVLLSSRSTACPECGGEVRVVEPDPSIYYWDPMD